MRIGIISINRLVKIRKSFRFKWRAIVILLFLFYALGWWMTLTGGYARGDMLPGEGMRIQAGIFFTLLSIVALIALFRKDDFARVFFATASAFCALNTVLFTIYPSKNGLIGTTMSAGASLELALGIALVVLSLVWKFLIVYSYVLWLSVIPYGPGRACRQQVIHSLRAEPLRRRNLKTYRRNQTSNKASSNKALIRFLTLGSLAVVVGLSSWVLASMVLVSDELAQAIHHLRLFRAFDIMRNLEPATFDKGEASWQKFLWGNAFMIFGYFNFVGFSFLWNRWRRSKIPIDRASTPQYIPPASLLLLRHSKDDDARISRRKLKLSRFPFLAFPGNYTFEELMAERLAFVGRLYSLGSQRDESPMFNEGLEWLRSKIDKPYPALRWLASGVEKLRQSLPKRLPPQGAPRFYPEEWRAFVKRSMPEAQAIITIIGSVKDNKLESPYLQEELAWIKENGYLEKTIFLMPSILLPWKERARWRSFIEYVLGSCGSKKGLPKAKRVLGVCFYMNEPVIITGSEKSELFYESALDVAGAFAGTTSDRKGEMIMKRRTLTPSTPLAG
ncbi:MAG TPA: hypothetical protein VJS44_18660 [Pyrinomonadaceae bacterium]|nr:hypothetical protein [Pyrinomonadaceae bacterium]